MNCIRIVATLLICLWAPFLFAGDAAATVAAKSSGLATIDWLIIFIYAASTIGLGWYFGRKQKTTEEYFVGSGNMNPFLIGVSLFATLLSTITYLSMPGEIIGKGPAFLTRLFALPFVFIVVGFVLLPVYMRTRVTSAYELLEDRLGLGLRMFGVCMFLSLRLVWMTLLVYLAAKAMTVMMGVDAEWIPGIVLVTGIVSIIYTSMGGLRAVVITDLLQTILLFGGALLIVVMISIDFEGFGWFPVTWHSNWDEKQPFFDLNPKTRITVVGTILSVFTWYVCTSGGDQVSVQRFMSTRDASTARRALATQLAVGICVNIVLALVGFALLGYFEKHPEFVPAHLNFKKNADEIFPLFIAFHLPQGASGLVVAAMFAAAMSSIDSGVNSISAVVMTDLLDRFGLKPKTEKQHVMIARCLAVGIGAVIVIGSLFIGGIEGNITKVTQKTVNLLVPPVFSLFFFALFVKSANPLGVWIGTILGIITATLLAFCGRIVFYLHVWFGVDPALFGTEIVTIKDSVPKLDYVTANDPVSFLWIGPVSLVVNIVAGLIACQLVGKQRPHKLSSPET